MDTITYTYFVSTEELEAFGDGLDDATTVDTQFGEDGSFTIAFGNGARIVGTGSDAGTGLLASYSLFDGARELVRITGFDAIEDGDFEVRVVYETGDTEVFGFDFLTELPSAPPVEGGSDGVKVDFGDGFDEIRSAFDRADITTAFGEDGSVTITSPEGTFTISGLDRLETEDGAFLFDVEGDLADEVYRFYTASLDRRPDEDGFRFWVGEANEGSVTLEDLAGFFIDSPEFSSLFGEGLSDTEFVTALYETVLDRAPDAAGLAFWTGVFESGEQSREDMLAFFVESPENRERTEDDTSGGFFVETGETATQAALGDEMVFDLI